MKNKRIYRGMFLSLALIAGCEGVKDSPSSADGIKDSLSSTLTEGTAIQLGETITIDGEGATASDQTVRITQAGTYLISGTLEDGQIQVEVGNQEEVNLVLNETQISSTTGAPILITQSAKTTITLMEGTQNVISHQMVMNDGEEVSKEEKAAIFSQDDLMITGTGSLTVDAKTYNGIVSQDDLVIEGGNFVIESANHGLKGKDSVVIEEGTFKMTTKGDAIQSDQGADEEKGFITIRGGDFDLVAEQDGIQAQTKLVIEGGTFKIETGGGYEAGAVKETTSQPPFNRGASATAETATTPSAKGLKAGQELVIEGGSLTINSADDALHTNGSLWMNGGEVTLSTGDDGLHADETVEVNGGTVDILTSYEGLEGQVVRVNDGVIRLVATDDGINAAGGMDGSGFMSFFNPTTTAQQESESGWIELNGGWLYVNASGDGLDANGSIIMTGGVVIVEGPTSGHDGILDFDETFDLQGGQLIASGGVGMLQTPSETSTQPTLVIQDSFESGELIHIQSEEGAEIVTFSPSKASQVLIISSPDLKMESTYRVLSGGTYSVEATDGVYQDGTYTEGEERFQVVLSDLITSNGTLTGDGMRGPGMKEGPGMRGTKDMREAPEMKDHPKMEMNSDLKTPTLNSF
mgnify:FL=1